MSIDKKYTIKYAAVQGFYWAAFCAILGFTAVFLLDKGYSNTEIGIIIAFGNVAAVVLQPLVASMADKYVNISLKVIMRGFSGIIIIVSVVLLFVNTASVVLTSCMTLAIIAILVIQPFMNTISVQLEEKGIAVNFGVCRACGSLSFAAVSTLLGILIKYFPVGVVPFSTIILLSGLVVCTGILLSEKPDKRIAKVKETGGKQEKAQGLLTFLLSNKKFLGFLGGVTLIFYNHMITCNYLIQIVMNVGGGSAEMGIANALAAVMELPAMIFFSVLVSKAGCRKLLRISGIFFTVKFLLFFCAKSVGMIYFAQLFQIGGYALFIPASVYYVSRLLNRADMVKGQSLVTTAITLGGVFASITGGRLLDTFGVHATLLVGTLLALLGTICLGATVEEV